MESSSTAGVKKWQLLIDYLAMAMQFFADNKDNPRFAAVILPLNLPQTLTYGIPADMQGLLQPGMRVEVSLGRNKQYSGIVERLHNYQPEGYQVKPIRSVIDEEPVVNDIQLRFWEWIGKYYLAAPGEVMQAALPAHLKLILTDAMFDLPSEKHDGTFKLTYAYAVQMLEHSKLDSMKAA